MNHTEYKLKVEHLYDKYLELHRISGGNIPKRSLGMHRAEYEELYVDLTCSKKELINKIDKFKEYVLKKREEQLDLLKQAYPGRAVIDMSPSRSDGKAISYEETIEKTEKALAVYLQREDSNISIAASVFGFKNTDSEQQSKSAEKKVQQYIAHAEMLVQATGDGTFFEKLTTPLPKK